jgi:hypothetical protein
MKLIATRYLLLYFLAKVLHTWRRCSNFQTSFCTISVIPNIFWRFKMGVGGGVGGGYKAVTHSQIWWVLTIFENYNLILTRKRNKLIYRKWYIEVRDSHWSDQIFCLFQRIRWCKSFKTWGRKLNVSFLPEKSCLISSLINIDMAFSDFGILCWTVTSLSIVSAVRNYT